MKIKITLHCPDCQSTKVKKNGRKSYGKQNYFCKACGRQFIGDHALRYRGCHSGLTQKVLLMFDCDSLEVDELWTYAGKKSDKVWLIYAYHGDTGEIVAFVWGKRDLKTAKKLKTKLSDSGVSSGSIATLDLFESAYFGEHHRLFVEKSNELRCVCPGRFRQAICQF